MVKTRGQFRWLVTAWLAAEIASVVASSATESSLPAPLREYLATEFDTESYPRDIIIPVLGIPLLIALIVEVVGLYCFWRFARPLTIITWVVFLIGWPFLGPVVDSGLADSCSDLATLINGVIIGVIYMTPAKEWFERDVTPNTDQ